MKEKGIITMETGFMLCEDMQCSMVIKEADPVSQDFTFNADDWSPANERREKRDAREMNWDVEGNTVEFPDVCDGDTCQSGVLKD
jgi:hypothetical protein